VTPAPLTAAQAAREGGGTATGQLLLPACPYYEDGCDPREDDCPCEQNLADLYNDDPEPETPVPGVWLPGYSRPATRPPFRIDPTRGLATVPIAVDAWPLEPTHLEHRGPGDWRPVTVTTGPGDVRGLPRPPFPLARTGLRAPRNVGLVRTDGSRDIKPQRSLRRHRTDRNHR
jgi:hypothetical protein